MLNSLHIQNMPLVEQLELEFSPGFTVITGETGAGKSLMISAIGLALGDRPRGLDIDRQKQANITAEFTPEESITVNNWLEEQGLMNEENTCLLRRMLSDKRSKGYINGSPVGLTELQQLGDMLVNQHSQHQHHSLLERNYQRKLLDTQAGCTDKTEKLSTLIKERNSLTRQLTDMEGHQQLVNRELELARHNLAELNALAPQPDEYTTLDQSHKMASRAKEVEELLARIDNELEGGNPEAIGIQKSLRKLSQDLDNSNLQSMKAIAKIITDAYSLLDEALNAARQHQASGLDEPDFASLDERLGSYHQIARKHNARPDQLVQLQEQIQQRVEELQARLSSPQQIHERLKEIEKQLEQLAEKISKERAQTAQKITEEINTLLSQLAMPNATFGIDLDRQTTIGAEGWEKPQFLLKTNPGSKMQPLKLIASGGELSRCSLAIYLACTQNSDHTTMIFDEVDVGVSGSVADIIGKKLKQLAQKHQVICITHQPQIAARADHHYSVQKTPSTDKTAIVIDVLEEQQKITEIARMIAGSSHDSSLELAKEMYVQGRGLH